MLRNFAAELFHQDEPHYIGRWVNRRKSTTHNGVFDMHRLCWPQMMATVVENQCLFVVWQLVGKLNLLWPTVERLEVMQRQHEHILQQNLIRKKNICITMPTKLLNMFSNKSNWLHSEFFVELKSELKFFKKNGSYDFIPSFITDTTTCRNP